MAHLPGLRITLALAGVNDDIKIVDESEIDCSISRRVGGPGAVWRVLNANTVDTDSVRMSSDRSGITNVIAMVMDPLGHRQASTFQLGYYEWRG